MPRVHAAPLEAMGVRFEWTFLCSPLQGTAARPTTVYVDIGHCAMTDNSPQPPFSLGLPCSLSFLFKKVILLCCCCAGLHCSAQASHCSGFSGREHRL